MLKKIMATVLSVTMVLAMLPATGVFAEYPTTALAPVYYMDNGSAKENAATSTDGVALDDFEFEGYETDVLNGYPNRYYGGNADKGVFFSESGAKVYSVIDDGTNSSNQVLQSYTSTSVVKNNTRKICRQANQMIRFSFDVRFTSIGTGYTTKDNVALGREFGYNDCLYLTYDSVTLKPYIVPGSTKSDLSTGAPIDLNKWYKVTVVIGIDGKSNYYLTEKNSDVILVKSASSSVVSTAGSNIRLSGASHRAVTEAELTNGTTTVQRDNAELMVYTPANCAPEVLSNSVSGGAQIKTSDPTISVTFDQPISTTLSTATIAEAGGTPANCTIAKNANKLNTYDFTYVGMEGGKNYTLDISGCKNDGGKAVKAGNTSIAFSTEESELSESIFTEDFETNLLSSNRNGWNGTLDPTKSFIAAKQQGNVDTLAWVNIGSAENANYVLQYDSTNSGNILDAFHTVEKITPAYDEASGKYEQLVMTYKLNLKDFTTSNPNYTAFDSRIRIGVTKKDIDSSSSKLVLDSGNAAITIARNSSGKPAVNVIDGSVTTGAVLEEDNWYDIIWLYDSGKGYHKFTFVDSDTKEIVWTGETFGAMGSIQPGDAVYVVPYWGNRYSADTTLYNSQIIQLDDIKLYRVKPWAAKHKVTAEAGNAVVDGNNSYVTLSFNQPVFPDMGMFGIYEGTTSDDVEENKRAFVLSEFEYVDFTTQKVKYSNLNYLTDYVLDYSGVKAISSAEMADSAKPTSIKAFTTGVSPEGMFIKGDIDCTTLNNGGKVSFDLYSKESGTATFVAAFYERSFPSALKTVQILENYQLSSGDNKIEIDITEDIDADYIRVFTWDRTSSLVPLMPSYKTIAPIEADDTVKVLMIGNSLSEDAQRHLNDVATAGGKNFDVTVKHIGGASLAHHAANLKRELAAGLDVDYDDVSKVDSYIHSGDVEAEPRALYATFKNTVQQSGSGDNNKNRLLITALKEDTYDVISLQQFSAYSDEAFDDELTYLAQTIRQYQPKAEIMLYQTWSPYYSTQHARTKYFTQTIEPAIIKWAGKTGAEGENITLDGNAIKIIPAGFAFNLAEQFYDWCGDEYLDSTNVDDTTAGVKTDYDLKSLLAPGLMRDHNHASYYGSYLADCVWYEIITGEKAPTMTSGGTAIVDKPSADGINISDSEHLERLKQLSDIAHQAVLEYRGEFER